MQLILYFRKKKILSLGDNIEKYRNKLEPFKNLDDYGDFSKTCQRTIKRVEEKNKNKMHNNFNKVMLDYTNNRVYKWNKKKMFEGDLSSLS